MEKFITAIILTILSFVTTSVQAQQAKRLQLSSLLQSKMVMQQNKPFKVWGYAHAGETVAIQADWMAAPVKVVAETGNKFLGIIPVPPVKSGDFTQPT